MTFTSSATEDVAVQVTGISMQRDLIHRQDASITQATIQIARGQWETSVMGK